MHADIGDLVRPTVRELPPVGPFSPRPEGRGLVNLRFNENTFSRAYGRYPDHGLRALALRYRETLDILEPPAPGPSSAPGDPLLTRGAVDALELVLRTFFEPGADALAVTPPNFGFFDRLAALHGVRRYAVPLRGCRHDELDVDTLLALPIKGVLLCDPGNPTSTHLAPDTLRELLERFPGLVVLDETYAELAPRPSHRHLVARHPRLVVLRSMSKGLGLANLRLGAVFADPVALAALRAAQSPFPVPGPVVDAALAELTDVPALRRRVDAFVAERTRLAKALADSPLVRRVHADAGFVTIEVTAPPRAAQALAAAGLDAVVEPDGWPGHLRLSVATPPENDRITAALAAAAGSPRPCPVH
ncbi:aminotransferase class I/II-fold pyridoxal phosphate-dependent enzyme [Streptomyces purpureus]|uniref:Aminotransferase n=1 Tax=Streptomyces purpureus TaxID=1951 RepID=A0A918GY91_9ACTN|nr:histidinol-phosphate transaminase [Streptomyces purpureus]GGT18029.1 histidinol-phosphate aminotransferase [Streptomyces purpureus]